MKVYKFGEGNFYDLIIEEDNGEVRVASVTSKKVVEYIAEKYVTKEGIVRVIYGGGSSMPFRNADGSLNMRIKEIINEEKDSV
jgi:hypothetical protein